MTELGEVGDGDHGQVGVGVDEALATRYDGKVERRLRGGGESADVRYHHFWMKIPSSDPIDGIRHVLNVAS